MKRRIAVFLATALAAAGAWADKELANNYTWTYSVSDNAAKIVKTVLEAAISPSPTGHVTIPSRLGGADVRYIGWYALYKCGGMTSVTIPSGVRSIEDYAFYGCGLTSATIPSGVGSIGRYAFGDCRSLTSVAIPNSVNDINDYAFHGCDSLRHVSAPQYVCTRGMSQSFSGVYKLIESVTILNGVEHIGDEYYGGGFHGCTNLRSVTIPNSVTRIVHNAFSDCNTSLYDTTSIPGVKLVDGWVVGVTESLSGNLDLTGIRGIGDSAFSGCSGLTSVTIPDSVTSIGKSAFSGCSGLTSVTIPDSVTSIGKSAFSGCSGLTSVTIGNGVTSFGDYAFSGCTNLMAVNITDFSKWCGISFGSSNANPLYYAKNMFLNGSLISGDLTIPGGVTYIGSCAFSGCSWLTSVTIPDSVTSIGTGAFSGCSGLKSVTVPQCVCSQESSSVFPAAYQSITNIIISGSVTSIGSHAFSGCSGLASVTIPSGVTNVGLYAFSDCSGLKDVHITDFAKWCGISFDGSLANPFCYAKNLFVNGLLVEELTIPDGVTSIGDYAFSGFSRFTSIAIPDSVTSIGWGAFKDCSSLTSVTIPDSVTSIGNSAFVGCSGLTSVTMPDSVTSIGNYVFYNCSGLTSVTIPNSVKSIGQYAFYGCSGLTSVTIPNSVTNIGFYAFSGCGGLKSVTIPNSVTNIVEYAFSDCSGLTNVTIPDSVTRIGSFAFRNCSSLASVTIPDSVTSIGKYAFLNCSGLTSVTIPDSVTSIGTGAFSGCSGLTSVTVPQCVCSQESSSVFPAAYQSITNVIISDSVTSIGDSAFRNCSSLASVTIPNSVTSIEWYAFGGCSGLTSVTIPDSVTSIGDYAFSGCSGLTSVAIPDTVTSIELGAFYGCSGLMSVTIGNSVRRIGQRAFEGCSGLTSVHITDLAKWCGISFSGSSANPLCYARDLYLNDERVTNLVIPDGVTSIKDYAFYGYWLRSIVIPNSVTRIGSYAFYNSWLLKSVTMTGDCPFISSSAFSGMDLYCVAYLPKGNGTYSVEGGIWYDMIVIYCDPVPAGPYTMTFDPNGGEGGTSVTLDYGAALAAPTVTREGYTFVGWSPSVSATVPAANVTYTAQWKANQYTVIFDANGGSVNESSRSVSFSCAVGTLPTPVRSGYTFDGWFTSSSGGAQMYASTVVSCAVTYYAHWTWTAEPIWTIDSAGVLTSVDLNDCKDIVIPESVTGIGKYVFRNCSGLASVKIPDSVTSIGVGAFSGCSGLEELTLPFVGACRGNTGSYDSLFGYIFGTSSYTGGTETKQRCSSSSSYSSYYIPSNLRRVVLTDETVLGYGAFYGCSGLTSVTIPDSAASIGSYAFSHCSGLMCVTIGNSVTNIGSHAFYNCTNLASVAISDSVTSIGASAFSDCHNLAGVYITDIAKWCWISFGDLTANPLYYAKNLFLNGLLVNGDLSIPAGVTSIGWGAFCGCSGLTSVTIPNSVTSIWAQAFSGCSGLTSVAMKGDCPTTDGSAFSGVNSFCAAYLPKENDTYSVVDGKWRGLIVVYCDLVPAGPYTMTFDANGGIGGISVTLDYGAVLAAPTVTRDGYTFAGWLPVVPATVPAANVTYTAKWQVNKYKVTFDANGGSVNESTRSVALGSAVGSLPTPTRTGCSFAGWWTSATGGTQISASTKITGAVTYYAHWTCAVTFNANGGSVIEASRMVAEGGPVGTLPTPTRSGYIFDGWFTAESGGMQISASTVISCAVIYYAHWTWTDQPILTIDPAGVLTGVDLNGYTDIVIPVGVTSIGSSAFKGCSGLTSVTIPNSVTSIGAGAFEGCSGLEEITLPFVGACRGDAGRDDSLFGYIFGRTSYTGSTKTWQQYSSSWYAYYIPSSLRRVVVTDETVLGYGAFSGCSGLTSVTIPDLVTSIGSYAFSGCSLSSITIPSSVAVISESAFSECGNLKSVTIKEGVSVIGDDAFRACGALKTINLPSSVRIIGDTAFANSGLTSMTLPQGVGNIGYATFANCLSLASVTVPSSVKSIEYDAFVYCSALKAVTYLGSCPDVSDGEIYYGTPSSLVSYVPAGDATWAEALAAGTWMDRAIKTGTAAKTYTVQFHKYDGSGATRDQVFKVGETKSLLWMDSQLKWTREGYEFIGWVPWNPDSKPRLCKYVNGQKVKDLAKEGETVHLWAAWKSSSSYRVCFNRNDGSGEKMNQVILRNKEDTLAWLDSQIGWTRPGYVFKGWAETATGAVKYANGAKVKNLAMNGGTKNLYAVWAVKSNAYVVQYHRYDGSGETKEQEFKVGEAKALLWLTSQLGWSREGYEFIGWVPWNPDAKARLCKYVNGQKVADLAKGGETFHLWAAWKSKSSFRVCFNRNDGSGVKMNQVILRNKEDTLAWMDSQIGWTRDGYAFQGWAETASGAVKYANGAKVKNLAMDGGTKNLYAVWKAVKKSVKMSAFFEPVEYVAFEEPGELPGMVVEGETADGGTFRLVIGEGGAAVLYLFDGEGWSEERCEVAAEGGVLAVAVDGEVAYRVTLAGEVPLLE